MKALIVLFTLCGNPQYVLIHDKEGSELIPFKQLHESITPVEFSLILHSDKYIKRRINIDDISGHLCV